MSDSMTVEEEDSRLLPSWLDSSSSSGMKEVKKMMEHNKGEYEREAKGLLDQEEDFSEDEEEDAKEDDDDDPNPSPLMVKEEYLEDRPSIHNVSLYDANEAAKLLTLPKSEQSKIIDLERSKKENRVVKKVTAVHKDLSDRIVNDMKRMSVTPEEKKLMNLHYEKIMKNMKARMNNTLMITDTTTGKKRMPDPKNEGDLKLLADKCDLYTLVPLKLGAEPTNPREVRIGFSEDNLPFPLPNFPLVAPEARIVMNMQMSTGSRLVLTKSPIIDVPVHTSNLYLLLFGDSKPRALSAFEVMEQYSKLVKFLRSTHNSLSPTFGPLPTDTQQQPPSEGEFSSNDLLSGIPIISALKMFRDLKESEKLDVMTIREFLIDNAEAIEKNVLMDLCSYSIIKLAKLGITTTKEAGIIKKLSEKERETMDIDEGDNNNNNKEGEMKNETILSRIKNDEDYIALFLTEIETRSKTNPDLKVRIIFDYAKLKRNDEAIQFLLSGRHESTSKHIEDVLNVDNNSNLTIEQKHEQIYRINEVFCIALINLYEITILRIIEDVIPNTHWRSIVTPEATFPHELVALETRYNIIKSNHDAEFLRKVYMTEQDLSAEQNTTIPQFDEDFTVSEKTLWLPSESQMSNYVDFIKFLYHKEDELGMGAIDRIKNVVSVIKTTAIEKTEKEMLLLTNEQVNEDDTDSSSSNDNNMSDMTDTSTNDEVNENLGVLVEKKKEAAKMESDHIGPASGKRILMKSSITGVIKTSESSATIEEIDEK